LLDLVKLIEERFAEARRPVERVVPHGYAIRFAVRGAAGSQEFDVYYNGKGLPTKVRPVGHSLDERQRDLVLGIAEDAVAKWRQAQSIGTIREEFRSKAVAVLGIASGLLTHVRPIDAGPYHVSISTEEAELVAYHDAKGNWTRVLPTGRFTADATAERVAMALLERLQVEASEKKQDGA
jgi:hypothetical protein